MIRFHVINVTRDRRTDWQLKHYHAMLAAAEQKAIDERIQRDFDERVRKNELRRALSHAVIEVPMIARRQAG